MGSITCDRVSEWKAFDDTKAGVKGLVDAGITTIPQIIIQDHHTKHKFDDKPICRDPKISIPIIDLKRIHRDSSLRSQGTLFELLSEALGLDPNYLKDIGCVEEMTIGNGYYPECPQP
ncbi:hypothetical protein WN943_029332 [Citrus x changshan-huyou]